MFSGLQVEILDPLNYAGQGFGECGVDEGKARGNTEEIYADDAGGDDNGLGVCPVEKEEVVTKLGLAPAARWAGATGSRIGGHDTIAKRPALHGRMDFGDDAGEFVPEDAGRGQHAGVVPASEHLEVRATGQGGPDADADLALGEIRFGQALESDILLSMEYGGAHD
jgi:hypothetical protein